MSATIFEFGDFELDCERFELRCKGCALRVERKPLELLILLASSGGRLVSRAEMAKLLWPSEVFVDTEHGINTAIRKVRRALGDDPDHPCFLETVNCKGYRFIGVRADVAAGDSSLFALHGLRERSRLFSRLEIDECFAGLHVGGDGDVVVEVEPVAVDAPQR